MAIPHAAYVDQSTVIEAPLAEVWSFVKLARFSEFYPGCTSSVRVTDHGIDDEAIIYELKFQDGSVLTVKEEAKSLIDHSISYSTITAKPAVTYSSVLSTITLKNITSSGSTFAQFTGAFSSDADAAVVADASFKRSEALANLAKIAKK